MGRCSGPISGRIEIHNAHFKSAILVVVVVVVVVVVAAAAAAAAAAFLILKGPYTCVGTSHWPVTSVPVLRILKTVVF